MAGSPRITKIGTNDMKVCIVGAGAVGGLIGARLALDAGAEVSALARGATLAALNDSGWHLKEGERQRRAPVRAA
ncbi:MAG: 2-dehydropantoate 2-reductase N-terminal domain-containing protein, partial [Reyranellaceae bacterium]